MTSKSLQFYRALESLEEVVGAPLPVDLSPELVGLLSEQLYRSPAKAIEELVVNGFDADASESRVFVPTLDSDTPFIVVYDDGSGMTYDGLADLWKVGRAKQRESSLRRHGQRKQIGKFGIGKLATYTIANRVTYVTKTNNEHLGVTIDYRQFVSTPNATSTKIELKVHKARSIYSLQTKEGFKSAVESIGLDVEQLANQPSWTIVILEDLKEKAQMMQIGRLKWVLRTAMPLSAQFNLLLNNERLVSSKEDYDKVIEFGVHEIPDHRINSICKTTGDEWRRENEQLVAPSFPSGISGEVTVRGETLIGKSEDLGRSNGFFVYIRGRLINEKKQDALFGLHALLHQVWNRFRADIHIDDLDQILTANREDLQDEKLYHDAQQVLLEVFNEARQRYEDREKAQASHPRQEDEQKWVPERLVEHPTADALTRYSRGFRGTEADESWMYLNVDTSTDIQELAASLYASTGRKKPYTYLYSHRGKADRLVKYNPFDSTFTINEDHELALAYQGDPNAQSLLRHIAVSEALLEVYLREANIDPHVVGQVLEKRDLLLRGLADSNMHSLPALGDYIRRNATDPTHLEIGLVAGARALGFVAKHRGGPGQPDGIARFTDFPGGEQIITLEAKSSHGLPSAKDIDFASLNKHMSDSNAAGCLLVAPGYQGNEDGNSAASANSLRISCWTAEQLANVVEMAESRQISARRILEIVKSKFSPNDVSDAVNALLSAPNWEPRGLYLAVVQAIKDAHNMLSGSPRTVQIIATLIAQMDGFEAIQEHNVEDAIRDLAGSSAGGLLLREGGEVVLNVDYDELDRRVQALTGVEGRPRRLGAFGEVTASPEEQPKE